MIEEIGGRQEHRLVVLCAFDGFPAEAAYGFDVEHCWGVQILFCCR